MIPELKQIVARHMYIEPGEIDKLTDSGKMSHVSEAVLSRYMICYILHEKTLYSLARIGKSFQRKINHATVLHGINTIQNEAETNPKFKKVLDAVMSEVDAMFVITDPIQQDVERQIMSYFT